MSRVIAKPIGKGPGKNVMDFAVKKPAKGDAPAKASKPSQEKPRKGGKK